MGDMDDFVVYVCWACGRTLKWPRLGTSAPNLTCGPHYTDNGRVPTYAGMLQAWPPAERKEPDEDAD